MLLRTPSPLVSAAALAALIANLTAGVSPAFATARTWVGAGGSAATSTNWSPAGVPAAGDNVLFGPSAVYTVDFPASVGTVASHAYKAGWVSVTTSSPHVCSTSFSVGTLGSGAMALLGGNVKAGGLYLGVSSTDWGHMTITSGPGIPTTSSVFEVTDTSLTQDAIIAGDGKARLEVFGGSLLQVDKDMILANTAAARCTLNVAGRNATAFTNSTLSLTNPRFSGLVFGAGQSVMNVTNGGLLFVAGKTSIGGSGTSIGTLSMSGTTFGASAFLDGPLYVGGNPFSTTAGGSGSIVLGNRAAMTTNSTAQFGDADGGPGGGLSMSQGSSFTANQGMSFASNGSLTLNGGLLHVPGGTFVPSTGTSFAIGLNAGATDTPQFWLHNHAANTYVSQFNGILVGGFSGGGTLHVTGAGTTFGTSASAGCVAQAPAGSTPAAIVVDTGGVFEPSGSFQIVPNTFSSSGGDTRLTINSAGKVHALEPIIGGATSGTANATVSGAGSLLQFTDKLYVGGTSPGSAGASVLLADTAAAVTGTTAGSLILVMNPAGTMTVAHGAVATADSMRVLGTATVDGGTYAVGLANVANSGAFTGRGTVTGTLRNGGTVSPATVPGTFGTLHAGTFTQIGGGKTHIILGHAGGPVNDTVAVAGAASFNGTLELVQDPSFSLAPGDTFVVVTYASHSATYPVVTWNSGANTLFTVTYQPTRLILTPKPGVLAADDGAPRTLRFAVRDNATRPSLALEMPSSGHVRIDLYDVNGRRIANLQDGDLAAGRHDFALDAARRGIAPGLYFARATVGERSVPTLRVVLLH